MSCRSPPGNFFYVGAADVVPEIAKRGDLRAKLRHFGLSLLGIELVYGGAAIEAASVAVA